jgi:hypothetical protein
MVLHVSARSLRRRRDQLRASADKLLANDPSTAYLLLFYAAECGLKERLIRRCNGRDTSVVEATHDLRKLAKLLRLPGSIGDQLDRLHTCRLDPAKRGSVPLPELHQAWRYGAKLDTTDEERAQSALRALITWCEQDM